MKKYTILLLYPDYITGGGVETYLAHVSADDPPMAVRKAQKQAWRANPEACYTDGSEFKVLAKSSMATFLTLTQEQSDVSFRATVPTNQQTPQ